MAEIEKKIPHRCETCSKNCEYRCIICYTFYCDEKCEMNDPLHKEKCKPMPSKRELKEDFILRGANMKEKFQIPTYGGDIWLAFPKIKGPLPKNVFDANEDIMKEFKKKFGDKSNSNYWIRANEYIMINRRLSFPQMVESIQIMAKMNV